MEKNEASMGSPIAGLQASSPVRSLSSPTGSDQCGVTPIPATPADPGFILSPHPTAPIFQGFDATPQPQGQGRTTPTSSPVAVPSFTPPSNAAHLPAVLSNAVASPAPATGAAAIGLTPPPNGCVYGEQATPPTVRLSAAAEDLSAPPTVVLKPDAAYENPLYGKNTAQTPISVPKPGRSAVATPFVPPSHPAEVHTPTWDTPPQGNNTDETPATKDTGRIRVASPVMAQAMSNVIAPSAGTKTPAPAVAGKSGVSPSPSAGGRTGADLGLTPPAQGYMYNKQATPEGAAAQNPWVPPTANLHTPTWNTPPYGQRTGHTPSPVAEKLNHADARAQDMQVYNCRMGAALDTAAGGPADLGLTPPRQGSIYTEPTSPVPMAVNVEDPPVPTADKLHTPTWNTPPYGQNTGHTPSPLQERRNLTSNQDPDMKVYNCNLKIGGVGALDQSENQPPTTLMED